MDPLLVALVIVGLIVAAFVGVRVAAPKKLPSGEQEKKLPSQAQPSADRVASSTSVASASPAAREPAPPPAHRAASPTAVPVPSEPAPADVAPTPPLTASAPSDEARGPQGRADASARPASLGSPSSSGGADTSTASAAPTSATAPVSTAISIPPSADEVALLRKGLSTTRGGFIARLARIFRKQATVDPSLVEQIEEVLLGADLGVKTSSRLLERVRAQLRAGGATSAAEVWGALREEARSILAVPGGGPIAPRATKPTVIVVVGVNGVGKTTTIGKLASGYVEAGQRVILAAGDTFRAAAVLQLEAWGRRVGCEVVKGKDRADPGAVLFDAVKRGIEQGADFVIADTAGRLHTKAPLMDELRKLGRTVEKALGRPADEIVLVLDATTGQNALQQVQLFGEALPLSGIVLTKLDGSAKGGVVLGIAEEHRVPIRYVGVGERIEDLRVFDARGFVEALFEQPDEEGSVN